MGARPDSVQASDPLSNQPGQSQDAFGGSGGQEAEDSPRQPPVDELTPEERALRPQYRDMKKRVVWVKKEQKDSCASLVYGLGVSIVHLALFVLACLLDRPDVEAARALPSAAAWDGIDRDAKPVCVEEAERLNMVVNVFLATHVVCFASTVSREFLSTDIGMCGSLMRVVEVFCVPLYIYALMLDHESLAVILVRTFVEPAPDSDPTFKKKPIHDEPCRSFVESPTNFLCDKCPRADAEQF
jgi:Na+-transporting methylmalonyl-CoA/oxaloacetate decarboxylase gamma subunit